MTVYATHAWKSNAHLIRDAVVPLGYLRKDWPTLDPTYGTAGGWWKLWRPDGLEAHDLRTTGMDFRSMPPAWKRRFRVVAYDAPYKMNGRATPSVDARYGVDKYMSVSDRRSLMVDGFVECHAVLDWGGFLLAKCQDQVCGGRVHWQTDWYTDAALALGMTKVDRFDMLGGRPQPARTRKDGKPSVQQHARRNGSTLLVFYKPPPPRRSTPRK